MRDLEALERIAGLEFDPWNDDWTSHNRTTCLCRRCSGERMDQPVYGLNFKMEILQEAKTRKCHSKRCKRQGCDCI